MVTLSGSNNADTLTGTTGNDSISAGSGNDLVYGGAGSDTLLGEGGADTIQGGAGADSMVGGGGDDMLSFADATAAVSVNLATGATGGWATGDTISGFEDILGSAYADTLIGANSAGHLYGGGGNDLLRGGTGSDTIEGGIGNDTILGGVGADTLAGGLGTDMLSYADATSGVSVNLVTNAADGWAAGDVISGFEDLTGSAYADTLTGVDSGSRLYGGAGGDQIFGGSGSDSIQGGAGADSLAGGAGVDMLDYSDATSAVSVNLASGATGGWAAGDTIAGFENLTGSAFADTLIGTDGSSKILGGAGDDRIFGGSGSDTLQGGLGADSLAGGLGTDVLDYSDATSGVSADLGTGATGGWAAGDTIAGFENLLGSAYADTLAGDGGANLIEGGSGADRLSGGEGDDTLTGGAGRDTIEVDSATGNDRVSDFDMTLVDGQTADLLDVSELVAADGSPLRSWDVGIGDDGAGNAVLSFPGGETLVLVGISPAVVSAPGMLGQMGVPCFARGSRIDTPDGARPVEDLRPGDRVCTTDGPMPVLWHGRRALDAACLQAHPEWRPVRLRAGHFGLAADLTLSPQHAVALGAYLVRARHLAEWGQGAHVARGLRGVSYHHILLPRHALIRAQGARVESFYPGREALAMLGGADLAALRAALGLAPVGPAPGAVYGPRRLPLLNGRQARALLAAENARLARRPHALASAGAAAANMSPLTAAMPNL